MVKRFTKQKTLLLFLPMILLCICLFSLVYIRHDTVYFHHLLTTLFQEEMYANTLNLHYTIASPENYGLEDYRPVLPCWEPTQEKADEQKIQALLTEFQTLHPSRMNSKDQKLLLIMTDYLENVLSLSQSAYQGQALSPSQGVQSELPILLAEYTFRTEKDVTDYLSLLVQSRNYLLSMCDYEEYRSHHGYNMPAAHIDDVISQCDTIVRLSDLKSGNHFLEKTFEQRLKALVQRGILTQEQMQKYLLQNEKALINVVYPTYREMIVRLKTLRENSGSMSGLSSKPDGMNYYRALFRLSTGSGETPEQMLCTLQSMLSEKRNSLQSLLRNNPQALELYLTGSSDEFPLTETTDILSGLRETMQEAFPPISESPCTVTVKDVDRSMENFSAPAFYLTTPIDDPGNNVIYINRSKTPQGLELFTTLAHEGYPGHLYQNVYHAKVMELANTNPARELISCSGFTEGWALYVEFMAYDQAYNLYLAKNMPTAAAAVQIEKKNRDFLLCLYSLLDLEIHYNNADLADVTKLLESVGITAPSSCEAIYSYIVGAPCNYPKYYVGYLEILRLKEDCRKLWQEQYSDLRFHQFLLENGPASFVCLKELAVLEADELLIKNSR